MSDRPDWNEYFMDIARVVAQRSDCRRSKVGAVITDTSNRIVSTGYVGTAPGERGCLVGSCPRGLTPVGEIPPYSQYDNCISTHAELNALLYSDRSRHEGGSIYVTREPCQWCYKVLRASGLKFANYLVDDILHVRRISEWKLINA